MNRKNENVRIFAGIAFPAKLASFDKITTHGK
jgi:hypothetical protein